MKLRLLALSLLLAASAFAAPPAEHSQKPHPLFDRLKGLAGTWETKLGGQRGTTVFRIVANGSAIEENLMPETASMINMIHPDGDALMFTHYCAGANQPRYRATKFDGNSIDFTFVDGTNVGDSFMAGVKLTLVDGDHLKQEWTNREKGKDSTVVFEFTRVK